MDKEIIPPHKTSQQAEGPIRKFFSVLGPGLVTGAADDDPSGIATYSIAGAQLGTSLLWTAGLTWPLMACVQMMCARIGMVTGKGLASALHEKFPRPLIILASVLLLVANTINIGSDLSGMADAASILSGVNSHLFVVIFGIGIGFAIVHFHYLRIANVLKWMALFLFSYVITAFLAKPDWAVVLKDSLIPTLPKGNDGWSTLVAILGTTISPYLFFWQSSQEVEEEKSIGRISLEARLYATDQELKDRRLDVAVGTLFSNLVMFFIILTTALTLNRHGLTNITSSREVSEALRPMAGDLAMLLYTIGIIGVGLLAIPTLAGSSAYAFAEMFNWNQGLDEKFRKAQAFYGVILASILCGIAMNFLNVNPIKALYWTGVVNGLLAPFLLVGILMVARDKVIMQGQPSSKISQFVVLVTTILMFCAGVAMFVF